MWQKAAIDNSMQVVSGKDTGKHLVGFKLNGGLYEQVDGFF